MMDWDKTDKLYDIANDRTKSADRKKSEIVAFMREWGILTHSRPIFPVNHATSYLPTIDPYTQSSGGIELPGQPGHTYHPGY